VRRFGAGGDQLQPRLLSFGSVLHAKRLSAATILLLACSHSPTSTPSASSIGGYAAVQSTIVAPDLVGCAIGYAGVYDLFQLAAKSKLAFSPREQAYMARALGHDEAALKAASPVYNADKIKATVFLIHGSKDTSAPIAQAEALRKSLAAKGRAVRWLVEPKEGHGFYAEAARQRMYEEVLGFLKENTKTLQATAPPEMR
jgi:dipeptidyl aminopeptidase/acylaminoacyl peptidase